LAKSGSEDPEHIREEERVLAWMGLVARIEARMKLLGLNPYSAAKRAGLGGDYVRDIVRGRVRNPSTERLGKLAEALECSLYYLLGQDEIEIKQTRRSGWNSEPVDVPQPPAPLPDWSPREGKPNTHLLPIKFELMADAFRKVTDVVRPPLGFEAATIPLAYLDRDSWWEVVRDDSVARVAPPGSLVQVVEMRDDERDQIAHGEYVVVVKRMVGPDAAYHLVERSMRRVVYRYPDLGLWFLEYAHLDPEMDLSDEVWREGDPTAPRRSLDELAMEIEDPEERDQALAQNKALRDAIDRQHRGEPAPLSPRAQRALDRMNDPDWQRDNAEQLEQLKKWRPRLVGKVVRVLTPLDPRADFWMGSAITGALPK
jgi:transcriptional regulator with XRE-family HTH domain